MKSEKIATINDRKTYFSVSLITQSLDKHFFFKQQINEKLKHGEFLKLHWSDFHLSSLGGVFMSFPVIPVDTISV